ncbi:CoA transferase [Frankia sp. AgB1.9]|uniref:CoA transferase n=1 Tax=unclassified Frankia TaxID=2632575 RepID=UPI001933675E|nr:MULTISPECIES: CoA transferase [unclassified Frankia]MBL7486954.1 CoA transferase [Frankia sp. AgW1.1]MBL7552868.1 CoA transferase [Frankia sp. AgB1.9]
MGVATMVGARLDPVLTDWAADLRAGRIGSAGWAGGVEPAWAASGAMALTGQPDGPPLGLTVPLVARLDAALQVIRTLAASLGHPFPPAGGSAGGVLSSAGPLLGERAAALGLTRGGVLSAGRAARLVQAADGWLAVNLARPDDVDLLPAWLEAEVEPTAADRADDVRPVTERSASPPFPARPWTNLAALVATRQAAPLVERAELLGLAVSLAVAPAVAAADEQALARGQRFPFAPFLVDGLPPEAAAPTAPRRPADRHDGGFSVVDLSSLWAGPLCAQLLGLAGGRVVKVEGVGRLDGARQGPPDFYDLLHAGQASVTVELRTPAGRAALVGLIERADVVLEASRPRALEALGIDPADMITRNPRLTWVSITGYGRTGPWRQRPAFGDDAAAAAGAVAVDGAGSPVFLGDAIADPVTGVLAAAGALASVAAGGGHQLDVALREAVGSLLAGRPVLPDRDLTVADGAPVLVAPPRLRPPCGRAAPAGQDNDRLLTGAGPSSTAGRP